MGCGTSKDSEARRPESPQVPGGNSTDRPTASDGYQFDAFLSHNWGADKNNHGLVKHIGKRLLNAGVRIWIDEDHLNHGHIKSELIRGVNASRFVVVFITSEYLRKIASEDSNDYCYFEFKYAVDRRPDGIVPVVVEKGASDVTLWNGLLQPYRKHMHIDLSCPAEEISPRQIKMLADILRPPIDPFTASDDGATTSKNSAGSLKTRGAKDSNLIRAVDGLTQEEMEDLAEQDLPEVAFKKLQDPHLALSVEEQVECLTGCIAVGATRAKQATGMDLLMFIGNTGAGKSTMVNFLHGCDMETFTPNPDALQTAIRVKKGSKRRELRGAKIGHGKQSMTFIPGIGSDENFTYLDCPGFLDNRGAEINIANTVNVKKAISEARSVRVVVLINFWSLLADKGKGFRDLAQILQDLFGSAAQLEEHAASIALGLSKVPALIEDRAVHLKHVQALLKDTEGLPPREAQMVATLSNNIFIANPAKTMNPEFGWKDRDALINLLCALERICEPSKIFQTVLTPADERALRAVVEELSKRVADAMKENNFVAAARTLASLTKIDVIDNLLVARLLFQASEKVHNGLLSLRERGTQSVLASLMTEAKDIARQLEEAARALRSTSPGYAAFAEQAVTTLRRQTEQRQDDIEAMETLRRDMQEYKSQSEAIQRRLKELERLQATSAADVAAKEMELEQLKLEKETEAAAAEHAFAVEKKRLSRQMEASTAEEKQWLMEEVSRLQRDEEENRARLEDEAAGRERQLQETLEANKRMAAEQEKERAEMLRRQQEVVAREVEKKLEEANRATGRNRNGTYQGHTEADLRAHEQNVVKAAAELAENEQWRERDEGGLLLEKLTPIRSGGSWSWRFADSKLDLHRWWLGDEAVTALVALLQPCPNLDGSWEVLPSLTKLILSANQIGDAGAAAVAGALKPRRNGDGSWTPPTALTKLGLAGNRIGDAGAAAVAGALEPRRNGDGSWTPPTALTELDLWGNRIGDAGAAAVAGALEPRRNGNGSWTPPTALTELDLWGNQVGDAGCWWSTLSPYINSARRVSPSAQSIFPLFPT